MRLFGCLSVLLALLEIAASYNILLLTPMGSRSHKIFYMGIANKLMEKGHHVTVVSGDKEAKPHANLRDIVIPNPIHDLVTDVFEEGGEKKVLMRLMLESPDYCIEGLGTKEVQDLKKDKYDLVMISLFFDFCYYSLIDHFKVPYIYLSPAGIFGPFATITGQLDFPAFIPNKLLDAQPPLSFYQRFVTVALNQLFDLVTFSYQYPKMEKLCKEKGLCRQDMPSFREIDKNNSLTIINSIQTLEIPPRPVMPNIIYAGGAHLKPAKALPAELEKWVQSSGDAGFIYFSLGSAVDPTQMPEKHRLSILKVFGSLKQKVLWKWNTGTMEGLPPNVRVEKWLPQSDILAHKKLRMFITHGGLLSTQESTYHGVPILGIPVMADQFSNIKEAEVQGWAKMLSFKDITETSFKEVIHNVLEDKKLVAVSRERSALLKDAPIHPADKAVFWVEYVIRNKGAPHLRSPVHDLSAFQLYNLDVWTVIIAIIGLLFYLIYSILKLCFRCCFGGKKASDNKIRRKNKRD